MTRWLLTLAGLAALVVGGCLKAAQEPQFNAGGSADVKTRFATSEQTIQRREPQAATAKPGPEAKLASVPEATPAERPAPKPEAKRVIDETIKAMGWKAIGEMKSIQVTGKGNMSLGGGSEPTEMNFQVWEKAPDKLLCLAEIHGAPGAPGAATFKTGSDGKVAWLVAQILGGPASETTREIAPEEAAKTRDSILRGLNWVKEVKEFENAELLGTELVQVEPDRMISPPSGPAAFSRIEYGRKEQCYVMRFTKNAQPATYYISTATHRLVKAEPGGGILSDYREVRSVLMPFKAFTLVPWDSPRFAHLHLKMVGFSTAFEKFVFNEELDDALFTPPKDLKRGSQMPTPNTRK